MNTSFFRLRRLLRIPVFPMTCCLWACLVGFAAESRSLGLADTAQPPAGSGSPAEFEQRLNGAADLIRDGVSLVPSCRAYFQRHGVDLDDWLAPFRPPHIVLRHLGRPFPAPAAQTHDVICGGTEGRPPFDVVFVDPSCFPRGRTCDLASLLLHELGHLARRDTHDHEPFDFFAACRLSACVDPARFR